ncbi:MAG: hypothetical protein J6T56_03125, partial [Bacteroidales bacterium]|nr:hypothetical protein [Bacteroidales bacterium]
TVGPNGQYKNLTDALNGIQACGAGGDITLVFESGSYPLGTTPIKINTGFMNGYRLTITSKAKNRDSVTFNYSGTNGAVQLDSTSNMTFSYITINNTGSGHAVYFAGPTENVTFYRCNLLTPVSATAGSNSCIGKGDNTITTLVRNFHLIGITISGGCRIRLRGTATNRFHGMRVDSNLIVETYDGLFGIEYADSVSFCFNTCLVRKSINQNSFGFSLSQTTADSVYGNIVNMSLMDHATPTGTVFNISGTTSLNGGRTLVANNVILGKVGAGWRVGQGTGRVVQMGNASVRFVHNSIYNTNKAAYTTSYTVGVHVLSITGASADVEAFGNVSAACDGNNQFALVIAADALPNVRTDYNNYWNQGKDLAVIGTTIITDLKGVQSATNDNAHSLSVDPGFIDITKGLKLKDYTLFMVPNMGILCDIEDSLRKKITGMGAYAGKLAKLDASLGEFAGTQLVGGQSSPVKVTLTNLGDDDLKSAVIGWSVNGTAQTPKSWSGLLTSGSSDTVTLGSVNAPGGKQISIIAWVYQPNQDKDPNPNNDTIRMQEFICGSPMKGSYTVGGTSPDFASFDEAYTIMT